MSWRGVIDRYAPFLPITEHTPRLTLHEGNTPLLPAPRLGHRLGGLDLWLKFEGQNPTGSFKDRGMVVAVAKAMEAGAETLICASTGNTSASAAAYAARAGLKAVVVLPAGAIALGKLAQALFYGARVVAIDGNFDAALEIVRRLAEEDKKIALVNSVNPHRLEGQKTAAFEVVDVLGEAPEILALPVGNAGNISAYWQGFKEYHEAGRASALPRMYGFQAAGAAPLVQGTPVEKPETVATAIRIGRPASRQLAEAAVRQSGGGFWAVTDDEILAAQELLARTEGVFAEPASAASIAGVRKLAAEGRIEPGTRVVSVLTGNGLKDPDTAIGASVKPQVVEASLEAVSRAIGGDPR